MRGHGSQWFSYKMYNRHPLHLKIKILGAVLELPAKQHCQSSPFTSKLGQIGQIGSTVQLVCSSQMAPRILIAMGADYSFYMKTIKTHTRAFFKVIIFSIGCMNTQFTLPLTFHITPIYFSSIYIFYYKLLGKYRLIFISPIEQNTDNIFFHTFFLVT